MQADKVAVLQSKFLHQIPKDMQGSFIENLRKAPDSAFVTANSVVVKNPVTATVLAFFLGNIGVGRFYIGDTGIGVAKIIGAIVVVLFSYLIPVPQALRVIIVVANILWKIIDVFLVNKKAKLKVYATLSTVLHMSSGGNISDRSGVVPQGNGVPAIDAGTPVHVTTSGTYGKNTAIAGVEYFFKEVLESDVEVTAAEENDGMVYGDIRIYIRQADKRAWLLLGTEYGGEAFAEAQFGEVRDAETAKRKADGFAVGGVSAEVSDDGELVLRKTASCGDRSSLLRGLNDCLCGVLDCFDKPAFLDLVGCVR